jgi:hypothetical protein
MKKIHKFLKSEADYVPRPFALKDHGHEDYLKINQETGVIEITSNLLFSGTVSGLDQAVPTFTAGETLSALRIVSSDDTGRLVYTDPTDPDSVRRIVGMTTSAGLAGQTVTVLTEGKYSDSNWAFDVTKRLFLGANGTFTQVAPTTGISVVLGHAQTPTTIMFDPEKPIALA